MRIWLKQLNKVKKDIKQGIRIIIDIMIYVQARYKVTPQTKVLAKIGKHGTTRSRGGPIAVWSAGGYTT